MHQITEARLDLLSLEAVKAFLIVVPPQVHRGRLPAQKVLPHPLPYEDAADSWLFQDAHLHFFRLSAHPPRPGPHPVPRGGQLPHVTGTTDSPQLRWDRSQLVTLGKNRMIFYVFLLTFLGCNQCIHQFFSHFFPPAFPYFLPFYFLALTSPTCS